MESPPGASWGKIDLIFLIHAIFYYYEQFTRLFFELNVLLHTEILMQLVFFAIVFIKDFLKIYIFPLILVPLRFIIIIFK